MAEDLDPNLVLEWGGVLPLSAVVPTPDTVQQLSARTYRHPVLDDQVVVRLAPEALGVAEDLTMEILGYPAPTSTTLVGQVKAQALGFPAWAIVNDPANSRHALALVKDLDRLAKTAKTRIGPARDGYLTLGDRLARTVPHFLPTYYEQAARAFLAAESRSYAATMFGRAREAERSYGLGIDENRQHEVFLEFALAGALTAKELANHARELAKRQDPVAAYRAFARLCVERMLGGLPPYASQPADLRRLIKAARLNREECELQLVTEFLAAPTLGRAPRSFWDSYRQVIVGLCRRDPRQAAKLLDFYPENYPTTEWIELLADAGAARLLTGDPADGEFALAPGHPATWLAGMSRHDRRYHYGVKKTRSRKLHDLAEAMAPRLRADGVQLTIAGHYANVDLDLLDLLLAHDVPLGAIQGHSDLDVDVWLRDDETPGARDLLAVSSVPELRTRLAAGIESMVGRHGDKVAVLRRAAANPGLRQVLHWWFDQLADGLVSASLSTIGTQVGRLQAFAIPEALAVNPEAVARILAHDITTTVGNTLRGGILDEFGWPALEQAVARQPLDKAAGQAAVPVVQFEQWPTLLLRQGMQVVALGPEGVVGEHLARIPAKHQGYWISRLALGYVDGEFLVCWDNGPARSGYWSGSADQVFEVPDSAFGYRHQTASLPIPGGGRTAGSRPLRVGDQAEERSAGVFSDGRDFWSLRFEDDNDRGGRVLVCREFDPATGEVGRRSLPAWFNEQGPAGGTLNLARSSLLPAAPGLESSPLGHRDGLLGCRVFDFDDGRQFAESISGAHVELPQTQRRGGIVGVLQLPGSTGPVALCVGGGTVHLISAAGMLLGSFSLEEARPALAYGTVVVPLPAFWHHLTPRDEAGSVVLREITDAQVSQLLETVESLVEGPWPDQKLSENAARIVPAIAEQLPKVSHPDLLTGIAGALWLAAGTRAAITRTITQIEEEAAASATTDTDAAAGLHAGFAGLTTWCGGKGQFGLDLLTAAAAALTGRRPASEPIPGLAEADRDWFGLFAVLPAMAYRVASPVSPVALREAVATFLDRLAQADWFRPGAAVRHVRLHLRAGGTAPHLGDVLVTGPDRRLLVVKLERNRQDLAVSALEWSADGRFGAVEGFHLVSETRHDSVPLTGAYVGELTALARARGGPDWHAGLTDRLAEAARLTPIQAGYLLAGAPKIEDDVPAATPAGGSEVAAGSGTAAGDGTTTTAAAADRWQPPAQGEFLKIAAQYLAELDGCSLPAMLGALLPREPGSLWDDGPDLGRLAELISPAGSSRIVVPEDFLLELGKTCPTISGFSVATFVSGLINHENCRWLNEPGKDVNHALVRFFRWAGYHLAPDHWLRPFLVEAAARAVALTYHQDLKLTLGWLETSTTTVEALAQALQVPAEQTADGERVGPLSIAHGGTWRQLGIYPAALDDLDDPRLTVLSGLKGVTVHGRELDTLRTVRSGELARLVAPREAPRTATGSAGHEQDPSLSVPALVEEVSAATGLGPDAAAVYLQLLALPDPTDRKVATWTGWKPARLKAARAELAGTELVIEGKRSRAGRSLFLPGGWIALKSPHLPIESWKSSLVTMDGGGSPEFGLVVPRMPVPELFAAAWKRVKDGDQPRFEKLSTGGRK